jgi:two-component system phosphate regulon response regulator PhoB
MKAAPKRILLVEDDRFLRRAAEATLRRRGYTVLAVVDGEEALRAVRTEAPDLVLLDLLMPKLNGVEVLRALKGEAATQGIPVLVLSNSSREQDVETVKRLGAVGYYVKAELSLEELAGHVAAILGE